MKQLKSTGIQHAFKSYKTWWDKRSRELVTYDKHWRQVDWDNLMEVGHLQACQNAFEKDEKGIFRTLYGKKSYYFVF